jgi:glucose/arabinose dehydrogenase
LARERGAENVWAKTPSQDRAEPLRPRDGKNDIGLLPLARDLDQPVALAFVPGTPGLAVVLEKEGTARLLDLRAADDDHPRVVTPSSIVFEVPVRSVSEMGLLGIAFHPQYEKNGRFFINYNPASGAPRTVIAEWRLPLSDVGQRRATFVRNLLEVEQPYANHDGGHLAFGPDGYLYIGLGDGGAANDPHGHGQNLGTLLGAMLRLNVDAAELPYAIPPDNPFIDTAGARAEIWAYGLRNPWRFSFDAQGRLIAGDVGQNAYEEIDIITRGANLGWNIREARHCFQAGHVAPEGSCTTRGLWDPIFEYGRELGSSVTGGDTYRGRRVPALKDRFVMCLVTTYRVSCGRSKLRQMVEAPPTFDVTAASTSIPSRSFRPARAKSSWLNFGPAPCSV